MRALWMGQLSLARAFWEYTLLYGALASLLATGTAFALLAAGIPAAALAVHFLPLPYLLVAVVGVYRSAGRYGRGWRRSPSYSGRYSWRCSDPQARKSRSDRDGLPICYRINGDHSGAGHANTLRRSDNTLRKIARRIRDSASFTLLLALAAPQCTRNLERSRVAAFPASRGPARASKLRYLRRIDERVFHHAPDAGPHPHRVDQQNSEQMFRARSRSRGGAQTFAHEKHRERRLLAPS